MLTGSLRFIGITWIPVGSGLLEWSDFVGSRWCGRGRLPHSWCGFGPLVECGDIPAGMMGVLGS